MQSLSTQNTNKHTQLLESTIFQEYLKSYTKYMNSLDENISDIGRCMNDDSCPQWIRSQSIDIYHCLIQKKQDYEYMHNDILKNPDKSKDIMERFIHNNKN